jgi:polysaccharide biosynthesis/export protein
MSNFSIRLFQRNTAIALSVSLIQAPIVLSATPPSLPSVNSSVTPSVNLSVNSSVNSSVNTVPAANDTYRLGAGDHLDIAVFDAPEFTATKVVAPDGTVTLPIVGSIPAAGRSTSQLTQELQGRLRRWIKAPVVSIGVVQFRPMLISIAGEVHRPGPMQMRNIPNDQRQEPAPNPNANTTNFQNLPTLSAAVANAGGLTRDADIRRVSLRRGNATIPIDLWAGISTDQPTPDYMLQDGDSIFVPKLSPQDVLDRRLLAKSSLAPKTIKVRVVGEVKKPGEVDVAPESTISGAVAIAGGATEKGKLKRVSLVRLDDTGKIQEQQLDLSQMIDSQQVQDGDVIIVPKSSSFSFIDVAGQVIPPLGILLNLFKK